MLFDTIDKIPGGAEFKEWFGGIPSFHDAEIIDIKLNRSGSSIVRIHTWRMQGGSDGDMNNHAIVTFFLEDVNDLELSDFNAQNVIYGLSVTIESDCFTLILEPSWGLSGKIMARRIRIEFQPGAQEAI